MFSAGSFAENTSAEAVTVRLAPGARGGLVPALGTPWWGQQYLLYNALFCTGYTIERWVFSVK